MLHSYIEIRDMMINFYQAAKRHFSDAELLMENKRHPNAGHLYGFAAECGIKSLLVWNGLPTDPKTGDIVGKQEKKKFRVHVHKLANNINTLHAYLDGRGAAKYLVMISNIDKFLNWTEEHRYYIESALPQSFSDWRKAAQEVMYMLDQATLDGVIE